ncbi:gliding motility-associated ABC transporter substrate-binding protein GldG [Ichthyobacterium seriolicida]|uniref:gliding motility-associated ABC transporter substrate-binding protein GldG n=1 Tax=Ichthyobacterium seriolicida TaxID=242600 RepID=UPI0012FE1FCA|nr:gliding motility-associated ABC transporter substrate-binding protein GldG [Ichthyobacterium seriolicida]
MKNKRRDIIRLFVFITTLVLINITFMSVSKIRIDFTKDKFYTIRNESKEIIDNITEDIYCEVYLTGDFPSGFKKLEKEVLYLLQELNMLNHRIKYSFVDVDNLSNKDYYINHIHNISEKKITPLQIREKKKNEYKTKLIFPYALLKLKDKYATISLLKTSVGNSLESQINSSIENLEYSFINGVKKITKKSDKKIAFLKGYGQLEDWQIEDITHELKKRYEVDSFRVDKDLSFDKNLELLLKNDLLIIAKPTVFISRSDIYLIDLYTMNGGKVIWALNSTKADMSDIHGDKKFTAIPLDLGLDEIFFKYGFRINKDLVRDLQCAYIKVSTDKYLGSNTKYQNIPWEYFPLSMSSDHDIVYNIEGVKLQFASSVDTILAEGVKKEILLQSSNYTKVSSMPVNISLHDSKRDESKYNDEKKTFGLLLSGNFSSGFKNRVKPIKTLHHRDSSDHNEMIVFSDGNILANQRVKDTTIPLGIDKWTGHRYGNKELILNSVDFLLDKSLIGLRNKKFILRTLSKQKLLNEDYFWKIKSIFYPLFSISVVAALFLYMRRRIYAI